MTAADGRPAGDDAGARRLGLGCFAAFVGFWSGGMIGVLLAKFVGGVQRCTPPKGLPACDWYYYALGGMLLGAVTLPVLVLKRLQKR
ncbi:MAG: hypothetical protein ACT4R6_02270 [Gemmatimonadaceae bacterium]